MKLKRLPDFEVGEPFFLRNLLIFPFLGKGERKEDFLTLEEATNRGNLVLRETGEVGSVVLTYEGQDPLFILDGEEVVGALQNRVLNTVVYAKGPVRARVPVSCVEESRWSGRKRTFAPGGISAYPSLRAVLASTVTDSLLKAGVYKSDQSLVWRSVRQYLEASKVTSPTLSMHDIYTSLKDTISSYVKELEEDNSSQIRGDLLGFIAYAGGIFIGMELFSSENFFDKFKKKLISAYVLEALTIFSGPTSFIERKEASNWTEGILREDYQAFDGVINGSELRFKGKRRVARAIFDGERFLHLSAFTIPDLDGKGPSKN